VNPFLFFWLGVFLLNKVDKMAATKDDIRRWVENSKSQNYDYVIIVCDQYDWSDFPVPVMEKDFEEAYKANTGQHNACKIMEVYDLKLDIESQLNERRAFHYPAGFNNATIYNR